MNITSPHLAYWLAGKSHLQPVRALTAFEIEENARFAPIFREAENRFKLVRILGLNYDAWKAFTNSLLTAAPDTSDNMLIADQLLLNFLATAYAITEHFKVSLRKRFKKDPLRMREYSDFLDRLCAGSWATAFFFDFRNYVQHIALPVGNFQKRSTLTRVEVTIEQDSAELLRDYKKWKRSKLDSSMGKLNLVELSRDYYVYLKRDYASFVAKTYYPELIALQAFYSRLAAEATNGDSDKRMVFIMRAEWTDRKLDVNTIEPPNDPMSEIGILVEKSAPASD